MNILITGGCGFIGSNFIRYLRRERPEWVITNFDLMTYAGIGKNLEDLEGQKEYEFVQGDIADSSQVEQLFSRKFDGVFHFAAESHVDRSITGPEIFVTTNVMGTQVLLEAMRKQGSGRFLHVSTDEVYGSLGPTGHFKETMPLEPNSPYSASKAGSDLMVRAYHETFKLETVTTRCSNNYGPYQFPEKFIPLAITNLLDGKKIPVYGDGGNIRDWIHVEDHCEAILKVFEKGRSGQVYNIGGGNERPNLQIARRLLSLMGKTEDSIEFVTDRLGHDRRYAVDSGKLRSHLGWRPKHDFETGLAETVKWYQENRTWWEPLKK